METAGKILELLGTPITMVGLWSAWSRASTRNSTRIAAFLGVAFGRLVGSTEQESRTVYGSDVGVGADHARVLKHDQVIDHLVALYRELDVVRAESRAHADAARTEIETAFSKAIDHMKTEQNSHAIGDLKWALFGLGTTATGMLIGICV
ncbi:MAG: hypothetical protein K0Q46_4626 [Rhodococcus erythropolis]|jgi:hypothetical protein|nr:hypothetical protein [Rhodococcus erythropolis]MDF2897840.1 hypothetical protein [Rhodococcus erythropolis]